MSEMASTQQVIYVYDGSFEGFLCCVFNYYYNRLKPVSIVSRNNFTPSFYENCIIETNFEQAYRVRFAIEEKIGSASLNFLMECLLTCLEEKEMYMLRFVVKGFRQGASIMSNLTDRDVNTLFKAHRYLERESHSFLGWVRFYKAGDVYVSKIAPENQVLSIIAHHFITRFHKQSFMIYDEKHHQALISSKGKYKFVQVDNIEMPPIDRDENKMQELWRNFYNTVSIKERYNPKCRMNFMPKRLWANLPEMQNTEQVKEISE